MGILYGSLTMSFNDDVFQSFIFTIIEHFGLEEMVEIHLVEPSVMRIEI